jgi:hypothetical protein
LRLAEAGKAAQGTFRSPPHIDRFESVMAQCCDEYTAPLCIESHVVYPAPDIRHRDGGDELEWGRLRTLRRSCDAGQNHAA